MVTYTYDAWGNVLSTSGTLVTTLGVDNPIRYRGYYYDVESGFYYLNSRYYDPYYGQFISIDSVESGDLFGYCNNDPVNNIDPSGFKPMANSKVIGQALKFAILSTIRQQLGPVLNIIGVAQIISSEYEYSEEDSFTKVVIGGAVETMEHNGNLEKPVTFYKKTTIGNNQMKEVDFGVSLNIKDGGIALYASSDISANVSISTGNHTIEGKVGLFETGARIGNTINFRTKSASNYTGAYVKPGNIIIAGALVVITAIGAGLVTAN